MNQLIKRTYRIRKDQVGKVRKLSLKCKCSESHFIRMALDEKITKLTAKV